ncbi:NAD(P)/FAD-dependent oxidoreductase [Micromonospora sp. KC723]|uniref:NAD(P)/FAD-dependent oxidoreductase n=1 Tax=Micromonospora sp. KC723 TaxID=2530381 RepID=UPI0026C79DEE
MSDPHRLIIIGSGPAGYTAAVYAARANLAPLVIEGSQSGGALMTTTEVGNFPGSPDGITGPELMDNLRKQADRFGAQFTTDDVSRVDLISPIKTVWVGERTHQARAVILATGSAWRPLGVPGEQELLGHGVSACATCDGFFFRDQDIAVVGGGDTAMEEATFLTRFARSVTIIHRRDTFRASRIMADRALTNDKIRLVWNSVPRADTGGGRREHLLAGGDGLLGGAEAALPQPGRARLLARQLDAEVPATVRRIRQPRTPPTQTPARRQIHATTPAKHSYRFVIVHDRPPKATLLYRSPFTITPTKPEGNSFVTADDAQRLPDRDTRPANC